jgi:hypothetical protein
MNRLRLISIMVALIVLGALSLAIFRAREPHYQGRTLTEWIEDGKWADVEFMTNPEAGYYYPESDPKCQAARYAVKQMAHSAIPFLLRWSQAKDSRLKEKLIDWMEEHPAVNFKIKPAYEYNKMAFVGFWLLENEGKSAWPTLIQWTYLADSERRFSAFACLANRKTDEETLKPVLLRLIHDPIKRIQYDASFRFQFLYPQDAEAAGVYTMFPQFKGLPTKPPSPIHTRIK